jgi:hypothetical protein
MFIDPAAAVRSYLGIGTALKQVPGLGRSALDFLFAQAL